MFVFAHGIVGRADLPIPEGWVAVAAVFVIALSFVALALGWTRPKLAGLPRRALFRLPRALEVVCGAIGVFVFFLVVYAGIAGTDAQSQNLAPTAVYVGFWIGIPFLSLLFGDVFRHVSPWRAVGRAAGWVSARAGLAQAPTPYPARLGRIPAAIGLFCFAICELCWADATQPGPLALIMLVYLVVMLVGMALYGVEPWVRNGDAFGVLFGLIGSLAPLGRGEDGRIELRVPGTGAPRIDPIAGTGVLLVISVGSTAFDGAKEGPLFNDIVQELQSAFSSLGFSLGTALELGFLVGLVVAVAVVGAIWTLGIAGMSLPPSIPDRRALSRAFAHTLIPISAGYMVAHYFSLLAYNGQNLWPLANDPLGKGSDLFGGAAAGIDYGIVSATGIWYVQIIALVAGHIGGLVLAHDRALEVYGSARAATRSQVVMLILMLAFTLLGLWLLSAALNT